MIPSSLALRLLWRPQLLSHLSGLPVGTVSPCSSSCFLHTHHRQKSGLGKSFGGETLGGRLWTARTELRCLLPKQQGDKPSGANQLRGTGMKAAGGVSPTAHDSADIIRR